MRFREKAILIGIVSLLVAPGCENLLESGDGGGVPALKSTIPSDGATSASVLGPVAVEFSMPLDATSIEGSVILLSGERRVAISTKLANRNRTVVLVPTDPLDFGTRYRVEISGTLMFRGGAALGESGAWEFTTEGLPPPLLLSDSLYFHVEALAHDTMRGRGSGSQDELRAAEYLQERFLAYGLQEPPGGAIQSFQAFSHRDGTTLNSRNVLGVVEGSGSLVDEWVVVGAHFDHIGFRDLPSEDLGPNNGADDNASGTALVLEMARLFRGYVDSGGMGGRDRRSVLFAAFGGEEHGLLGSCHYVHGAPVGPVSSTAAMMNFDMVGRLRENTLFVSGGETSSTWAPLMYNSNELGLNLAISESSCTGCTDHVCFWQAGIPFVGFFTGRHPEYHTPEDDVALVDFPGVVRIGGVALRALSRLTVMPKAPTLAAGYPTSG